MNSNLIPIYNALKAGGLDELLFRNLLGDNVGVGIQSYFSNIADLTNQQNLDYAQIITESFGNEVFSKEKVVDFLVKRCLTDKQIDFLCSSLNIDATIGNFTRKIAILESSRSRLKKELIQLLDLDSAFFEKEKSLPTPSFLKVKPFTPIPIEEKNSHELISKEYLCLHDYQKRIKDRVIQKLLFTTPKAKMLIHMPTGSGKTKTAMEAIIDFIKVKLRPTDEGGTVVWFAHSKELCEQAYNTFHNLWQYKGDFEIATAKIFGDSKYNEVKMCLNEKVSVLFIGFQKFNALRSSKYDFERSLIEHYVKTNTRLVVVDEAHKSLASTYEEAIVFTSSMPACRLIGLTATPGRSNFVLGDNENQRLADFFGEDIITITNENGEHITDPLTHLQNEGVLAKIEPEELEFEFNFAQAGYNYSQLSQIASSDDLGQKELDLLAVDPHRNSIIIEKIRENHNLDKSILVFACSIDHCTILSRILSFYDIENVVITGETNKDLRKNSIDRFKSNELKVIINYGVLSTGFDAPNLNTLIVARPTKSVVLYSQIVGRALRGVKNGGNVTNKLITIKDNLLGFPNPDFMFSYWDEFWN